MHEDETLAGRIDGNGDGPGARKEGRLQERGVGLGTDLQRRRRGLALRGEARGRVVPDDRLRVADIAGLLARVVEVSLPAIHGRRAHVPGVARAVEGIDAPLGPGAEAGPQHLVVGAAASVLAAIERGHPGAKAGHERTRLVIVEGEASGVVRPQPAYTEWSGATAIDGPGADPGVQW